MIDVHSHMLYGIDDGSKSIEESVMIIRKLNAIGITDIILTPHYINDSSYVSPKSDNLILMKKLQDALTKEKINTNLYLGNEIYIDDDIEKLLKEKKISSLNDTKYLLIELPMSGERENYEDIFLDLQNSGYQVVLAHPERYHSIHENFDLLYDLEDIGVLFQCNIGSMIGEYGKNSKKVLKRMLKENLVYMMATDIHHDKKDYNFIEDAKKKMRKIVSEEKIEDLLINNAKKLIN